MTTFQGFDDTSRTIRSQWVIHYYYQYRPTGALGLIQLISRATAVAALSGMLSSRVEYL